jgi:hypothetical protein
MGKLSISGVLPAGMDPYESEQVLDFAIGTLRQQAHQRPGARVIAERDGEARFALWWDDRLHVAHWRDLFFPDDCGGYAFAWSIEQSIPLEFELYRCQETAREYKAVGLPHTPAEDSYWFTLIEFHCSRTSPQKFLEWIESPDGTEEQRDERLLAVELCASKMYKEASDKAFLAQLLANKDPNIREAAIRIAGR